MKSAILLYSLVLLAGLVAGLNDLKSFNKYNVIDRNHPVMQDRKFREEFCKPERFLGLVEVACDPVVELSMGGR